MAAAKKPTQTTRQERTFHREEAEAALRSAIDHLTMLSMRLEADDQNCEQCDGINDAVQELYTAVNRMAV